MMRAAEVGLSMGLQREREFFSVCGRELVIVRPVLQRMLGGHKPLIFGEGGCEPYIRVAGRQQSPMPGRLRVNFLVVLLSSSSLILSRMSLAATSNLALAVPLGDEVLSTDY